PMGMPGRHGVDFMLILIAAKFISGKQYSASIATSGSALALMLPFWGFTDPFMPAYYIIIGVLTDVFFAFPVKNRMNMLVLGAIAGGLAYATIPISRIIISSFAGIPFLSLMKNGLFIPVLYHFLFGAAGSIAGVAVARLIKRK
ncbi:MAG: hypothetical protein KKA07_09925, partial [Bacteroidetes bacterium]|nr:hypothetical protein [Bacteroidota bacterium]